MINPENAKSMDTIVRDFPSDEDDEIGFDQYGAVHLCFI